MQADINQKCRSDGFKIPASCPFTISRIRFPHNQPCSVWLIREHDNYGEYPHIYAKICTDGQEQNSVLILSDTGCGTEVQNDQQDETLSEQKEPAVWNIRTFLEHTLNPGSALPYLIITTHCHYDHILGIGKLSPHPKRVNTLTNGSTRQPIQVLSSDNDKSFITPYSNLQKHSLSSSVGMKAPHYNVTTWASNLMKVMYAHPSGVSINTNIKIIQTPGHTPDSLSWYDNDLHLLCVGDSFYSKESDETRKAPWGPEPPMPTILNLESDLEAWWGQMERLLNFVQETNSDLEREFYKDFDQQGPRQTHDECFLAQDGEGNEYSEDRNSWNDPASDKDRPLKTEQNGFVDLFTHRLCDNDGWFYVEVKPPRVRLCAAHTNLDLDAENAIRQMKNFMAAVLRDEVPSTRTEGGPRGEEIWLWDPALSQSKGEFSVLAPLSIIEKGRMNIQRW